MAEEALVVPGQSFKRDELGAAESTLSWRAILCQVVLIFGVIYDCLPGVHCPYDPDNNLGPEANLQKMCRCLCNIKMIQTITAATHKTQNELSSFLGANFLNCITVSFSNISQHCH